MAETLNLVFESSLSDICKTNTSFDTAKLRICYSGLNRNKTSIDKSVIEKAIKTIYNCPIATHYNREDDSFGGHDLEVVSKDGELSLVNLTQPVGVIPESANVWFENYTDEDGEEREYLCADVLLWKRQEAYKKIVEDGIVKHSMEINVTKGTLSDGIYYIYEFEFTAFVLIGCEPCFEGSALEMYSLKNFKLQYETMLKDLKNEYALISTSKEDDIHPQNQRSKEGGRGLDNQANFSQNNVDNTVEPIAEPVTVPENNVVEEPETVVEEPIVDPVEEPAVEPEVDPIVEPAPAPAVNFSLSSNIRAEISRALSAITYRSECGYEYHKYWFVDYDPDLQQVYVEDVEDQNMYGMPYSMSGDTVVIDFENKKRKRWEIVDFEEGVSPDNVAMIQAFSDAISTMDSLNSKISKLTECESKLETLNVEVEELRAYKLGVETAEFAMKKEALFNKFQELTGIEEFDNLVKDSGDMSLEDIEEKCFALKGRFGVTSNFSLEDNKAPKIKIDNTAKGAENEPYGGIFLEYGYNK